MSPADSALLAMLDEVAARAADLTTAIVRKIRAEVPGYAEFPYAEHHHDVLVGVISILEGLRNRQPPSAAPIEHTRAMGRRRAQFRLALTDSIEAYHISYRELWAELLGRARASEPDLTAELVGTVGLLWNWVHRLSAAFAEAHANEARNEAARLLALRRRFVEALARPGGENAGELAGKLGFDPAGEFVVACLTSSGDAAIEQINAALAAGQRAGFIVAWTPGTAVLVTQCCDTPAILAAVRAGEPRAHVGVGLRRHGLRGAAMALADAQETLRCAAAMGRPEMDFTADWHRVLLESARPRLDPLLAAGTEVARANPALAATVRAFTESGYSISACARAVRVHHNSARYRLDRWRALTGWDPRTLGGLVSSMACLDLLADGPGAEV
jgi:hypothetical protein